jgi:hypothetical protein
VNANKRFKEVHICEFFGLRAQCPNSERLLKNFLYFALILLLHPDKDRVNISRFQRFLRCLYNRTIPSYRNAQKLQELKEAANPDGQKAKKTPTSARRATILYLLFRAISHLIPSPIPFLIHILAVHIFSHIFRHLCSGVFLAFLFPFFFLRRLCY